MSIPVEYASARLLCVDPAGAVLLQRIQDPVAPDGEHWVLPGGGIESGESAHDAACREAFEELGLSVDHLGEPVATNVREFDFGGKRHRGHNTYYAVRTERYAPVPVGMSQVEKAATVDVGWLTPDALDVLVARGVDVVPPELASWARGLHRDLPPEPLRPTARVLVVDAEDRTLLFCSNDGVETFWFPPGGGIEIGESPLQAARRELVEELGLQVPDDAALGPCVWLRRHVLPPGERILHGMDVRERWYLLRVDELDVDHAGWTPLEQQTIDQVRWWSLDELRAETVDALTPRALAELLPALLADHRTGRLTPQPVWVGV